MPPSSICLNTNYKHMAIAIKDNKKTRQFVPSNPQLTYISIYDSKNGLYKSFFDLKKRYFHLHNPNFTYHINIYINTINHI